MTEQDDRGGPRSALRWGFWMQFWGALYALYRVYPRPRLSAFVVVVLVVVVALLYDERPRSTGGVR